MTPSHNSLDQMLMTLAKISRRVIRDTMELRYQSRDAFGLDLERPVSEQVTAEQHRDILELMRQASMVDLTDRATGRTGALPKKEDAFAKLLVEQLLTKKFSGIKMKVVGEEWSPREWDIALNVDDGTIVFVVDPCDGTSVMRSIRSAFSVNIGVYRSMGERKFLFLGSVSTASTGETIVHDARDSGRAVMQSPRGTWLALSGVGAGEVEPGTLATVAARGLVRQELEPIFDTTQSFDLKEEMYGGHTYYNPPLTIYTTAGAPILASFPMSGVEYVYVPHDQTVWDAFPLAASLAAGAGSYFLASTMKQFSSKELLDCFGTLVAPSQPGDHPIPAGLLVREGANHDTTAGLLEKIHRIWKSRQEQQDGREDQQDEAGESHD